MKDDKQVQKIGVTAFVEKNGKVLILKRSDKEKFLPEYYELPGGKIEFGETPEDALKREIKEETNLEITVINPFSTFSYVSDNNKRHTIDIQFITKLASDIRNIKLSKEHVKYSWITAGEIKDYKISVKMKEALKKGFKFISKNKRDDSGNKKTS